MSNPTYSSDPVDPGAVPTSDPSQGYPETSYTDTATYPATPPTYTEPPAGDPYGLAESGYPATGGQSTTDMAKDEADALKDTAVDAGTNVAAAAKDEAANVASEAKQQAKSLLSTATSELQSQASTQQGRIASTLRGYTEELQGMVQGSQQSGVVTDLAQQAAAKGSEIVQWLEDKEPSDVLEEVRRFARRRPVMFLALCGLAGVVAGRITRGAVAANTSLDSPAPARAASLETGSPTTSYPASDPLTSQPVATYGAYADAPADYSGHATWSAETSVPAGYPDRGEPTR